MLSVICSWDEKFISFLHQIFFFSKINLDDESLYTSLNLIRKLRETDLIIEELNNCQTNLTVLKIQAAIEIIRFLRNMKWNKILQP